MGSAENHSRSDFRSHRQNHSGSDFLSRSGRPRTITRRGYNDLIPMKKILVTNDDGVRSDGIEALAAALRELGEVVVVAPIKEASAVGHALTLHTPLRIEQLDKQGYAVDGTPPDRANNPRG